MFAYERFRGGTFEARYRAYPVAYLDKQAAEEGDKVILPPSALDRLVSLHIDYPMLFKVENLITERSTHCGVLEFVAEEGRVYMPYWMMQNLLLTEGDIVQFKNASLPKGTYVKLQSFTSDFLNITNPKAVLERTLRSYSCLSTGDVIMLNYNNRRYDIEIRETKPGEAISVIETDCNVDFEAPKDYVEPPPQKPQTAPEKDPMEIEEETPADDNLFLAFSGEAKRLDGKSVSVDGEPVRVPLYTGLTRYPPPDEKEEKKDVKELPKNGKNGKFVVRGTGNRLLDKLQKDGNIPADSNTADQQQSETRSDSKDSKDDEPPDGSHFKAFTGKSQRLK